MNATPCLLTTCHWFALLSFLVTMFADQTTVSSPVCSFNCTGRNEITAMSRSFPGSQCEFFLSAPNDNSTILLNFTKLFGFQSESNSSKRLSNSPVEGEPVTHTNSTSVSDNNATNCLAELKIWKFVNGSGDSVLQTLCGRGDQLRTPHILHTNSSEIRLQYEWQPGRDSGFTLHFTFTQKKDICEFGCDGCVKGKSRNCADGKSRCRDGSQTANCNITVRSPSGDSALTTEYIPIIVIVPVVLLLGACVVIYYVLVLRAWRDPHPPGTVAMERRSQLHPRQPSSSRSSQSTTVYVPGSPRDRLARPREGKYPTQRPQPIQRDLVIDLPPHIAISEDGEGSFAQYQRLLQRPLNPRHTETVRAPPNRTVPPSYHSSSGGEHPDQETSGLARLLARDCNGWSARLPCRKPHATTSSLSNLVNSVCHIDNGQSRRSRHMSGESTSSVSHSLDQPPPEYSLVMAGYGVAPPTCDPQRSPCQASTGNQL